MVGAWCPVAGERKTKALSWLGCRSLENSVPVDPCQRAGIEGLPVNKHSNPKDSQRSKSPWHSVETSTQSEELLLLKTYVQIVQQSEAEVSKELNFMPLMRIIFPKGRSQSPSIQCNILQEQTGLRILHSQNPQTQSLPGRNHSPCPSAGHFGMG